MQCLFQAPVCPASRTALLLANAAHGSAMRVQATLAKSRAACSTMDLQMVHRPLTPYTYRPPYQRLGLPVFPMVPLKASAVGGSVYVEHSDDPIAQGKSLTQNVRQTKEQSRTEQTT